MTYQDDDFILVGNFGRPIGLKGSIKLNSDSDTWTDTKFVDANVVMNTSEYDMAVRDLGINTQTGLGEQQWGSWQTDWAGQQVVNSFTRTSVQNRGNMSARTFLNN